MTAEAVEPTGWTRRKWWVVIALIFLAHLGFILWLSARPPAPAGLTAKSPVLRLLPEHLAEIPGLPDPAMLVLPDRRGFSGAAWMSNLPALEYHLEDWPGTNFTLTDRVERLGGEAVALVRERLAQPLEVAVGPALQPGLLNNFARLELLATNSSLKIEGEITNRPLLSVVKLEPVPSLDILSNTVVKILVDEDGQVKSALPPLAAENSSGSKAVDDQAVAVARSLRFAPARRPPGTPASVRTGSLDAGWLTFRWLTVPPPATNAPAGGR